MKKLEGEVSVSELDEYFLNVINSDRKYSIDDYYKYVDFMEEEDRSILDDVEEDDPNYETLTDIQLRVLQFIEGTMGVTVVNKKQNGVIMCNQIDIVEIDMVTFEPIESYKYFYLDDPFWWSHNEQKYFNDYVTNLTNKYKSIVKSHKGSSSHLLGNCSNSYNYFLYLGSQPPNRFQKFMSERLISDYEMEDGHFHLHIYGPTYLQRMVHSVQSKH
jgi:hypothetical protein